MASDGIEAEVDEAELDGVIKAEWESTGLLALPSAVCCSCARSSLDPLMLVCQLCRRAPQPPQLRRVQPGGGPTHASSRCPGSRTLGWWP